MKLGRHVKQGRHDLHGLSGAYALDALTGLELDQFEHHLHRCPPCENEVRGFRETATRLALAVAASPPLALRERVLTAASVTRQLPPEVRDMPRARARPARGPWLPRLGVAVAAAAVAAAVALGVIQSSTQQQLNHARAENASVAAVLAAPDTRLVVRPTTAGGRATVVASQSRHALIISTAGLPALSGGKVYELWFVAGRAARRAGLLPAPAAGRTAPLLAPGLVPGDAVALTVEPAGGTSQPTTKPIVVVPLSS
ncbi:MAG TPA: anti-sigma factor [Streptosporangiaceae bacterium]|nr:anti-sigma factor [Streptosporangiaceae bacterium]